MVIWITGISGAGKTTLANAILRRFKPFVPELVQIDGDDVSAVFGRSQSYKPDGRVQQIQRIQKLAQILDRQNMLVLVSALYANSELLLWNRANFSKYIEVYINASIELVKKRDPKDLYKKFERGEICDIVGLDVEWFPPTAPDILIDADADKSPDTLAIEIGERVPRLATVLLQQTGV